ncbi:SDR family oxidoreductase [Micromonospora sp. DT53]|uniref:SDR family oxidoreductase n=1 Tax=Micromonospora sp. DT53 TaxID=3393444 RepID=UPI003CEBAB97
MSETVLVTGGSGFLGAHAIVQLLEQGYTVRTTVRSLKREADVRAMVAAGGAEAGDRLTLVEADLGADAGWTAAVDGVDHVLHVASPFPAQAPKNEDELIIPARDGTLRVLRAARDANVRRVVLTSSFAAIGYGHPDEGPFDETVWTDTDAPIRPYIKSKTIAEQAAWDFVQREGNGMELVVINPTGIFGPALGPDYSGSLGLVEAMLDGRLPFLPDTRFGVADVRDVAALHILAMTDSRAAGERFIAAGGYSSFADIARVLRDGMGPEAEKVPTRRIPTWLLKTLAVGVKPLRELSADAGVRREPALGKGVRTLGWKTRPTTDTILDTARSLIALKAKAAI